MESGAIRLFPLCCIFALAMNSIPNTRYFIRLCYHGKNYHGWQHQKNASSVQETLTKALGLLLQQKVSLVGCGRTDTGVHAREFFTHFDLFTRISEVDLVHLVYRLNRFLPSDIAVQWIREVPADLHARFSAISRTYKYQIHTFKDPFLDDSSWYVPDKLDVDLMNRGAELLSGHTDFTSFSKLHSAAKTNICHLKEAFWVEDGHRILFSITADRFLRNMVRAIVGTLTDLGHGKMTLEVLDKIVKSRNRSDAGQSVPAHGLYLDRIIYPVEFRE
jgi:tRNA pseudouridine38-40 synthase